VAFKRLEDLKVKNRTVLVRVDFNVPLTPDGKVADDMRLRASLPTLRAILDSGGKVLAMSHVGRPKGKIVPSLSITPVRPVLEELLGAHVVLAPDCVGKETRQRAEELAKGEILLLENLRFHPEEEANDPWFAEELASLGNCYVNDAFGSSHRPHASIVGVPRHLPSAAGLLLQKEIEVLGTLLERPEQPFWAILGGAKVSGKIEVIRKLIGRVDGLFLGGGMAFTFLRSKDWEVGQSLVEPDRLAVAADLMEMAKGRGIPLLLPVDVVVASDVSDEAHAKVVPVQAIPPDMKGLDIGPWTLEELTPSLREAKTIFWNGPCGVFEVEAFSKGTRMVAELVAEATSRGAFTVVGGGDSVAAIRQMGFEGSVSHLSTGGGASLEFLEGKILPGIAALARA
jgi:phosphoglycerate kinase